jgi:hypothetical protein
LAAAIGNLSASERLTCGWSYRGAASSASAGGVDDWDKAASFLVDAAQCRSTSSLSAAVNNINLQSKARPLTGRIEHYWFENEQVGLKKTRFHRIEIPFEPFDSGLNYVSQPESASLVVEWLVLEVEDPSRLGGVQISAASAPGMDPTQKRNSSAMATVSVTKTLWRRSSLARRA